jgi:PKD repeat protein
MMKNFVFSTGAGFLLLVVTAIVGMGCNKDENNEPAPLTIQSFSPVNGNEGALVVINGTGFSDTKENNIVQFNGITAAVTAASGTVLVTRAPAGVVSGKIKITVGNRTATSATDFMLAPKAAFSWQFVVATLPARIAFTNNTTHATAYEWKFGNIAASTDANPLVWFCKAGTYDIRLIAKSGELADTIIQQIVIVKDVSMAAYYPL